MLLVCSASGLAEASDGEGDGLVQLDMYDPRGVFRLQISLTLQLIKSNNGGVLGRSARDGR